MVFWWCPAMSVATTAGYVIRYSLFVNRYPLIVSVSVSARVGVGVRFHRGGTRTQGLRRVLLRQLPVRPTANQRFLYTQE
jgi:hypothetical protein